MSCEKTRAVLQHTGTEVTQERNSKNAPLTEADVRALLSSVAAVRIARGKAVREVPARDARPDDLRGPTGNFRAPMVRRGSTLLVGFSEQGLREVLG